MENQHRKITGYRELGQEEIDLMNKIKALGAPIEDMIIQVQNRLESNKMYALELSKSSVPETKAKGEELLQHLAVATPERFAALAKTDFQTALMYLTRAVAQPTFF